jgi:hypothetical protein
MPTTLETWNPAKLETAHFPHDTRTMAVKLGNSLTLARGTLLGKRTSDSKHYAYDDTKTDGTQTATAILVHDVITDSSGNHFVGTSTAASSLNLPHKDTPVYVAGTFFTAQLVGYDAAALADFQGRLLPDATLRIP